MPQNTPSQSEEAQQISSLTKISQSPQNCSNSCKKSVGLATFHSIPRIFKRSMFPLQKTTVSKLKNKNLTILTFYMYWRWQQIFKAIEFLKQQKLTVGQLYYKGVIFDIINPVWPNLIQLKLQINPTQSIQALQFMNCPQLKKLSLIVNTRSVQKPLNKLNLKNLSQLEVSSYRLSKVQLNRINFGGKNAMNIFFDNSKSRIQPEKYIQNLSFYSKLGFICEENDKAQRGGARGEMAENIINRIKINKKMQQSICSYYQCQIKIEKQDQIRSQERRSQSSMQKILDCLFHRKFKVEMQEEIIEQQG